MNKIREILNREKDEISSSDLKIIRDFGKAARVMFEANQTDLALVTGSSELLDRARDIFANKLALERIDRFEVSRVRGQSNVEVAAVQDNSRNQNQSVKVFLKKKQLVELANTIRRDEKYEFVPLRKIE